MWATGKGRGRVRYGYIAHHLGIEVEITLLSDTGPWDRGWCVNAQPSRLIRAQAVVVPCMYVHRGGGLDEEQDSPMSLQLLSELASNMPKSFWYSGLTTGG
jgi:hypothetical protein